MMQFMRDVYSVTWPGLRFMRHHWFTITIASVITPLLYVLAFGYGLGRDVFIEGYSYAMFVIPGIVALTTMSVSFSGSSSKLNVERLFYKSFDEYLMSPISFNAIILGKVNIGVIRGMISASMLLVMGFILEPAMNITPVFMLCMILSCFVFSLMGVMIALMATSHQSMTTFTRLVVTPMTFLCGTFFRVDGLPDIVRGALYCLPLTHSSECLRAVALDWSFPWISFVVLLIFALLFFIGCRFNIRRKVE